MGSWCCRLRPCRLQPVILHGTTSIGEFKNNLARRLSKSGLKVRRGAWGHLAAVSVRATSEPTGARKPRFVTRIGHDELKLRRRMRPSCKTVLRGGR